jgi:nitrile hydratase beta subunit
MSDGASGNDIYSRGLSSWHGQGSRPWSQPESGREHRQGATTQRERTSSVMRMPHYVGGMEGLPEPLNLEKRVFVEEWEKRIFGIHVAMMGLSAHLNSALPQYPIDEVPTTFKDKWTWADLRTGADVMNPFDYFRLRYYERWLGGVTQFLIDKGYISEDELASRTNEVSADRTPGMNAIAAIDEQVIEYLRKGDGPRRDVARPKFAVGDEVRITNVPAAAHTRLPRVSEEPSRHRRAGFRGRLCLLHPHR